MSRDLIAGRFYQKEDGTIVYVYGTSRGMASYHAYGRPCLSVNEAGYAGWEELPWLKDFPEEKDHLLPYDFDLCWDIKRVSGLLYAIAHGESMQGEDFDADDACSVRGWLLDSAKFCQGNTCTERDVRVLLRWLDRHFKPEAP